MSRLTERYPDLLGPDGDAARARAVAEVDSLYARRPPADLALAMDRAMARHLSESVPAPRRRPHPLARRRFAVAAGFVAAAALVGGAYAAVESLGDDGLANGAALETRVIAQQNLGKRVDASRGACGFTVTLNRVYADRHGVVVAYTLRAPAGHAFAIGLGEGVSTHPPTLVDRQGAGVVSRYEGEAFGVVSTDGAAESQIVTFAYRTPTPRLPDSLDARLTLPVVQAVERTGETTPGVQAGCATYGPAKTVTLVSGGTRTLRTVTLDGPFAFDIAVPVDASGQIQPRG